uniref:BHLH domain-containing protein n=1 Tax=Panagrolaimus sp. JU765 TaxID=591449 RepID=A0AC34PZF2_9BILA
MPPIQNLPPLVTQSEDSQDYSTKTVAPPAQNQVKPEPDWSIENQNPESSQVNVKVMSAVVTTPATPAASSANQAPINPISTLQPLTTGFNPTPTCSVPNQDLTSAALSAPYNSAYPIYSNNVAAVFDPAQAYWSQTQNMAYSGIGPSVIGGYATTGLDDSAYGITAATNDLAEIGKMPTYDGLDGTQPYAWPYPTYLNPEDKSMDSALHYNFGLDKNFYGHSFSGMAPVESFQGTTAISAGTLPPTDIYGLPLPTTTIPTVSAASNYPPPTGTTIPQPVQQRSPDFSGQPPRLCASVGSSNPITGRVPTNRSRRSRSALKDSDDDCRSDDRESERRTANNTRERIRVRDINSAFKELGKMCSQHLPNAGEKGQTKLGILHQAVKVINDLEERVSRVGLKPKFINKF